MAEKHDALVSAYRVKLVRKGYRIEKRSPFVDYRPDIYATRRRRRLFVEAEIEATLHSDHTLNQLLIMYEYLRKSKHYLGVLVVPCRALAQACLLVESTFGDSRIKIAAN